MKMLRLGDNIIINISEIKFICETTHSNKSVKSKIIVGDDQYVYSVNTVNELYEEIEKVLNNSKGVVCSSCKKRLPRKMDI